jgi:hypothetical protein
LDFEALTEPSEFNSMASFSSLEKLIKPGWLEKTYGLPSPSELVSPGFLGRALAGVIDIVPTSVDTPPTSPPPSSPAPSPPSPLLVASAARTAANGGHVAAHLDPMPRAATEADLPLLRLFPRSILRASREEYKQAFRANAQYLSKELKARLRVLRRKELSCVYADSARHTRIKSMKKSSIDIEQLRLENEQLTGENLSLRTQLEEMKRMVGCDRH